MAIMVPLGETRHQPLRSGCLRPWLNLEPESGDDGRVPVRGHNLAIATVGNEGAMQVVGDPLSRLQCPCLETDGRGFAGWQVSVQKQQTPGC